MTKTAARREKLPIVLLPQPNYIFRQRSHQYRYGKCIVRYCPAPSTLGNGVIKTTGLNVGNVASATCNEGFKLVISKGSTDVLGGELEFRCTLATDASRADWTYAGEASVDPASTVQ